MLIVFCAIFVGASYAVAAPTARFLELTGFEDNSANEKPFTANDFAGTYSRFMELSRSGHLCPKSLELLSNGVLKSDGSVQIQHVDAKINKERCDSEGNLSFHFGRKLEKSFIENQLKLSRESMGIEAVIRNIVFQLRNFYYAVETKRIECGGASLFSGTVLLFTSDSEVFGKALQIPWSGHPRIAFLRDSQKSCAFNGTWIPQRDGPIPIKSPAPVSLESSPSSMENEDTTAVPTEKPEIISSPAPPESDVSEANPTVTTVPPSSSAAISSTSAMKTSATATSSSTKTRSPPPPRTVPSSSVGSRGPPPTSRIPFTTTSKTSSSGTATVTTPSSSLSSNPMTSTTTISGTTTTVRSTAGMTTSAIATSSTSAAKKESSATSPTSTTAQDVTATAPESSASTAVTGTEATPTSSATTSTIGTLASTLGTPASTTFAPSATTKSPVTTTATITAGVGPTFSTIIVTTSPTATPLTTASSATTSPASVSSTGPTVSSTVTNAPVTSKPAATPLDVTDSNNPDTLASPGTDTSFQTSPPITATTVAASVTSPKSLPPTTSRMFSPTVTPTTPVTTPTGGSSTTAGISSSPRPSKAIPVGPGEQVNASVQHGSPTFTKEPILSGDRENPSPGALLEESPMPSFSPGGDETISMPSIEASVSPPPSKSIEPSPPPRQNSGASDGSSDESTCFPAHVLVKLSTGQKTRMDNIDIGDVVFVGEGQTSKVVGFTHSDRHAISKFVRFTTDSGKVLEVTSTHFVYTQRGLEPAGKLTKSDFLQLEEGRMTKVIAIDSVLARGLFNPHTVSGDIVVNGFVTSTYTTAVNPSIAHALLAPIRVLEGLGTKTSIVTMLSGNPWIVCMARRLFSGDFS